MERYYSLNTYLKSIFGGRVSKISIDAGFTCPNRDGSLSTGGCIFCSEKGSGDFAGSSLSSITEQIKAGILQNKRKYNSVGYIAYFQAFTNTYASVDILKRKYYEALNCPEIVGISIATRPDCLGDDVIKLLCEINKKTMLWVELGLQTSNEATAELINRGYKNYTFERAVKTLNFYKIQTVAHLILGLPGEDENDILMSVRYLNKLNINGVKLHLLHVLKDTYLANMYINKEFDVLTMENYIYIVALCIANLKPEIVIHRLTGDGDKNILLAPLWSTDKRKVLNGINKKLKEMELYQGKYLE